MNILPHQIDAEESLLGDTFGKAEIEAVAVFIVRWCQENGNKWVPFTHGRISRRFKDNPNILWWEDKEWLNRLIEGGFVSKSYNRYEVKPMFVERVYQRHSKKIEVVNLRDATGQFHLYANHKEAGLIFMPRLTNKWQGHIIVPMGGLWPIGPYVTVEEALEVATCALKRNMTFEQWIQFHTAN